MLHQQMEFLLQLHYIGFFAAITMFISTPQNNPPLHPLLYVSTLLEHL